MKNVDSAQFSSEVLGSKEPVVVDFYTQDCQPCRILSPVLEEWESESNGALVKSGCGNRNNARELIWSASGSRCFFVFKWQMHRPERWTQIEGRHEEMV